MEVNEKLISQISEMKYLTTENSYRYRPIMRSFYIHYEKLQYWLYKEDIFEDLKDNEIFKDYTIEECERDLEMLVEWLSLTKMQDTKKANTIEEFKSKKFRYQLTEYATVIERLTIALEDMEIKTASLEPKLFDRLRFSLQKICEIEELNEDEANLLWDDLNNDFTKLNQNYQDFLKKFNEPKSEELLQSVVFLRFKNDMIKYLREFVKGYQKNIYIIKSIIDNLTEKNINILLDKVLNHIKKTPNINKNFNFDRLNEVNRGKIKTILSWFKSDSEIECEGEKLMNTTDNIIVKITKYASSLIELHGNMTNRKEEYKHICRLFDKLETTEECHEFSSVIFGIENIKHFLGNSNIQTDTIVNTLDIPPIEILLSSRTKTRKEKVQITPIVDKSLEKERILKIYREEQNKNKEILKKLIKDGKIELNEEQSLTKIERKYIQKLLSNQNKSETEFGLEYKIEKIPGQCKIISEDGIFYLDSVKIEFEGNIE